MKIDQLPVEMLMNIFSYISAYWEASLVNKLFYSIACRVRDPTIYLRIDQQFVKRFLCNDVTGPQLMQSIQTSNRQISKMEIDCDYYLSSRPASLTTLLNSVLHRFSATIKFLYLIDYVLTTDESDLLEILSLVPNVERLFIYFYYNTTTVKRLPLERLRCNNDLNLKNLRSLTIWSGCDEVIRVFNRLPAGTLTELQASCNWNSLVTVLNRQFNIKKMRLVTFVRDDDEFSADVFDKLTLESLELESNITNMKIAEILSKQTKLKSLMFSTEMVADERVMNVVADLSELEVLQINITEVPVKSFVNIRKLKKLQDLQLRCDGDETVRAKLKALIKSGNTLIKKFSWFYDVNNFNRMSVDVISALAKSVPNLTHLNYLPVGDGIETERDAIRRSFNFVEAMTIAICEVTPAKPSDHYFNSKLTELSIDVESLFLSYYAYDTWMSHLIGSYPNLKKLKLQALRVPILKITPIVDGFTKLESLTVRLTDWLIDDDINWLHDYKGTLKFASLGSLLKLEFTRDVVRNMRTGFDLVEIDSVDSILNIAVDRYTMNCECETRYLPL